MKIIHIALGLLLMVLAHPASADEPAPAAPSLESERAAWLADYAALKESMAKGYANLDWIVAHRGLDLVELDRATTDKLRNAGGFPDVAAAYDAFFGAFGDPHLRPSRGPAPAWALRNAAGLAEDASEGEEADDDEPRGQTCAEFGYRNDPDRGAIELAAIDGWEPFASPYFPAGTSGRTGVLRIPSFDEHKYLAACEAAWQPGRTERETQLATRAVLQAELARLAGALRAAGAGTLAIDLTGNGGGSEWSEEAVALFTARELTRPSPRLIQPACDRAGVWRAEAVCANLAPAGETDRMSGGGAWTGPVLVLVDKRSASASEDFAYWLAGSGAARLVGERTFGAGCGYMDGGWAFQFTAFDAHVMMPNCSRYTAEGINQIEGLAPDVTVTWANFDGEGVAGVLAILGG